MQQKLLLTIFVLFIEHQRGASSPLVERKMLGLQQSPNCCTMSHLTLNQRYQIWALRHLKPAEIARKIGKHRSVVTREIAATGLPLSDYNPQKAQRAYWARGAKNATKTTPAMRAIIEEGLLKQWSPEQIKARASSLGQPMLSGSAIYNYVWSNQKQGGSLYQNLRHASKPYRKRYGKPDGRVKVAQQAKKPSIDQRPEVVNQKSRFGDWELDTVIGPNHKGLLLTITERTTNYLLIKPLADKSAQTVEQAIVASLKESGLPVHTLTSDNGTEFAHYQQVATALQADFYFAHPYHAWERGANENNNKLIRQYIPKKMDFSLLPHQELESYQQRINDRPRKKLNYLTPNQCVKSTSLTHFVAFQT